jgi:DNA replication and repair protein RecF
LLISRLGLSGFRGLEDRVYKLESVNNLIGHNGSGKTSFLEAVYLLCTGVSFLSTSMETIAKHTTNKFVVSGRACHKNRVDKLEIKLEKGKKSCYLNNTRTTQGKLFLRHPLCLVDAFVNRIVSGSPENRRKTIDRAMFHVEQKYLTEYKAYNMCLKQRNMALREKRSIKEIEVWDESLSKHGENITRMRERHITEIKVLFEEMSMIFLGKESKIEFKKGWSGPSLYDELKKNIAKDRILKRTSCGPQKDDFTISVSGKKAQTHMSHGQEKMLSLSYVFSQKKCIEKQTNMKTIILFDETDACLDEESTDKVINYLKSLNNQILTATHPHSSLHKKLIGKTTILKQS